MIFRASCAVRVFHIFVLCNLVFLGEFNDNVIFPDQLERERRNRKHPTSPAPSQRFNLHQRSGSDSIPLDLARKLNDIADADQFLQLFVEDGAQYAPQASISFRGFARSEDQQSKTPPVPKPAVCLPELKTISLRDTNDRTLFYYPSCTRIERCGGCCTHESLMCDPIEKQYVNYTIHVTRYQGGSKMKYEGPKVITIEKHLKCKCDCRIKKKDCTSVQVYEEQYCRCVCNNGEEERSCSQQQNKLWNPSSCACQCREIAECSSGFSFDHDRCKCVPNKTPNDLRSSWIREPFDIIWGHESYFVCFLYFEKPRRSKSEIFQKWCQKLVKSYTSGSIWLKLAVLYYIILLTFILDVLWETRFAKINISHTFPQGNFFPGLKYIWK